MLAEFRPAVEWLEEQYEYLKDDFRHPQVRIGVLEPEEQYSSYMANFKGDGCTHPAQCGMCSRRTPLCITSVEWTAEDDAAWLEGNDIGRWDVWYEVVRRIRRDASKVVIEA